MAESLRLKVSHKVFNIETYTKNVIITLPAMDIALGNPYQNVGILILVALLRYRRQLGRLPRRFFARPWIRQRRHYGQYHILLRELQLAEAYGNDYSR